MLLSYLLRMEFDQHDLTIELKICHEHDRFDGWTGVDHLMREIMK